jgi:hypothetical protein
MTMKVSDIANILREKFPPFKIVIAIFANSTTFTYARLINF